MKNIAHVEELIRAGVYFDPERRENTISKRLPEGVENIEILLDGEVYSEKDHKTQRFGRGTIFWHISGEYSIWNSVRDKLYRCAIFTFRVSERVLPPASIGMWQNIETLDHFVNDAATLYRCPGTDHAILGTWIYGTLLRQFLLDNHETMARLPIQLEDALMHIRSKFPEQVALDELTRVVYCSKVHLYRLFKQHFQCSPGEYILRKRLRHAANLLIADMDIKRVAEECRFESVVGFYRAFHRYYKITPGEYRVRYKCLIALPADLHYPED